MTSRPRTTPIAALAPLVVRPSAPPPPAPPRLARAAEVAHDPARVLRDYVLAPYPPKAAVVDGLAAVNLLLESFALADVEAPGAAVVARLVAQLGAGRVVWGLKHADGRLAWEFYVYDPGQERVEAALPSVRAALTDLLTLPSAPARLPPHHMWSFEVDAAGLTRGAATALTLYVHGDHGPGASRSYALVDGAPVLANLYTFHDPRREPDAIRVRVEASVHLGAPRRGLAAVAGPVVLASRRVCVVNKRAVDGLYFAGVDTDESVAFLVEHGWPPALITYLDGRRHRLAHLGWDLALDYAAGADGEPRITRTAIHATC